MLAKTTAPKSNKKPVAKPKAKRQKIDIQTYTKYKNKLIQMMELQKELNIQTNGEKWTKGINKNAKTISWFRCIYMEGCELIDSTPWKHWKDIDAKMDLENINIELVDIWHFLLSYLLSHYDDQDKLIKLIIDATCYKEARTIDYKKIIEQTEKLCYTALSAELGYLEPQKKLISNFFDCTRSVKMSFDKLNSLYIAKNVLNKFRQNKGYKLGKYQKIWNGVEDNVVLTKIVTTDDTLSFDEIYEKLSQEYLKVFKD